MAHLIQSENKRIGILGGTFNPVHIGHMLTAHSALEQLDLGSILLVPCYQPPHKRATNLISASHRLAMLNLAVEDEMAMSVDDLEIRRCHTSYTIDTIRALRRKYSRADLVFIIGSDTLPELHMWKNIDDLFSLCEFGVISRPGFEPDTMRPEDLALDPPWGQKLLKSVVTARLIDISSSDIRHRIAEGMSIRYLVPDAVAMYISEHRLYE